MIDIELDYSISDLHKRVEIVKELMYADGGALNDWLHENFTSSPAKRLMERLSNYVCGGKIEESHMPVTEKETMAVIERVDTPYGGLNEIIVGLKKDKQLLRGLRDLPKNKDRKREYNKGIRVINENMRIAREAYVKPINCFAKMDDTRGPQWLECDYGEYKQVKEIVLIGKQTRDQDLAVLSMDIKAMFDKIDTTNGEKEVFRLFYENPGLTQVEVSEIMGCGRSYVQNTLRGITKKLVSYERGCVGGEEINDQTIV